MGIKRIVDMGFWTDGKVDGFSWEDKYFMLYLLTNPYSKQLGIYEISIKQAAFQMGCSVEVFNVLLDRFETKYGIIMVSRENEFACEVAILNYLRHSIVKGGKPVEDCLRKEMTLVKNRSLLDAVFSHLHEIISRSPDSVNDTVKKIVSEYIENKNKNENKNDDDNEGENDNDNDNDNERIVDVSYHESYHDSSTPNPAPLYGTYNNVILSDKEIKDLEAEFPTKYEEYINRLSTYMTKHGKEYASHFATIKSWLIEDKAKDPASFDADVFFEAAVNHTKAKQKERTPEEQEALRQRMEALKEKIGASQ